MSEIERIGKCPECNGACVVGTGEFEPTYDVDEYGFSYIDGEQEITTRCPECDGTGTIITYEETEA